MILSPSEEYVIRNQEGFVGVNVVISHWGQSSAHQCLPSPIMVKYTTVICLWQPDSEEKISQGHFRL